MIRSTAVLFAYCMFAALCLLGKCERLTCWDEPGVGKRILDGVCYSCPVGCTGTSITPGGNCSCTGCSEQCTVYELTDEEEYERDEECHDHHCDREYAEEEEEEQLEEEQQEEQSDP